MSVTISEISDDALNLWIAENLEPAMTLPELVYAISPKLGWKSKTVGHIPFRDRGTDIYIPQPFCTDPALTVMLMEDMMTDTDWSSTAEAIANTPTAIDSGTADVFKRVVAEAWALAKGWKP